MRKVWTLLAVLVLLLWAANSVSADEMKTGTITADWAGQIVLEHELMVNNVTLPPGTYMLRVESGAGKDQVYFVEVTKNFIVHPQSFEAVYHRDVANLEGTTQAMGQRLQQTVIHYVESPEGWQVTKIEVAGKEHVYVFQ